MFIKAVLELELTPADLESVNPEAYEKGVLCICYCDSISCTALENLALTFADNSKPALLYESLAERNACVELKEGGTEIRATE